MDLKRAGNTNAEQHYSSFIDMCARSLASVINVLDPHVIVLGSGLSNVEEILPRYQRFDWCLRFFGCV